METNKTRLLEKDVIESRYSVQVLQSQIEEDAKRISKLTEQVKRLEKQLDSARNENLFDVTVNPGGPNINEFATTDGFREFFMSGRSLDTVVLKYHDQRDNSVQTFELKGSIVNYSSREQLWFG